MGKVEIVMIIIVIIELWFYKIVYKNRYEDEFEKTMKYIKFSIRLSDDNLKLSEKNLNLHVENTQLKEQIKCFIETNNIPDKHKKKNRVAKVIKEEKQ